MRLRVKIVACIGFPIAASLMQVALSPALSQEATPDSLRYSLDDAIALVTEEIGGRILRAEILQRDDRTVYQVRIITDDGRVRTIDVDAQNGIEEQ